MRFHDVVGRRIVAVEQDAGTSNLRRMLLDDGTVLDFQAEEREPGEFVILSRVVNRRALIRGVSALRSMLAGFEWRRATHPAGFGCDWLPVSPDVAKGLMYAAGLDQPLPRPGKEMVLHSNMDGNDDWPTVVLVNWGGRFEVRRY